MKSNEMKIIGEDKDIKHFKDEIDYEDSQIYLDPSNKNNTNELWVEEEDIQKEEYKKEVDEKGRKKVKFFVIKNTYEYPHEIANRPVTKKIEGNKKKKEKKVEDYDDDLTEEEIARLEEIRKRKKKFQEQEKIKKEKEKEALLKKQRLEEEDKKKKESQNRNAQLIKNKKKKKKK